MFVRYIAVFTVLVALGLNTNFQLFYFVLFFMNQEQLTEEVCEAVKPKCNACCYLEKKMEADPESSPAAPQSGNQRKAGELKVQEYIVHANPALPPAAILNNRYEDLSTNHCSSFISEIFHPPECKS